MQPKRPRINPLIFAEFAHVVYRFGHSMLTETVARTDIDMQSGDIDLISAFLNPVAFNQINGKCFSGKNSFLFRHQPHSHYFLSATNGPPGRPYTLHDLQEAA